ncbi:MAG TPA: hypothetical protein VFD84_12845 [Candidatus Binatia bacterium]|jgi:uncharacterized membrane protein YeaQ/YmgE (transglycosylase-associated protein family)|nr:hypothetical protein [Candidatus Binatia bacterium]
MEAPTLDEQTLRHWLELGRIGGIALVSGWIAEQLLDSNLRMPGTALVYGVIGLYLGTWLGGFYGFDVGPAVDGQSILAIVVGAIVVAAMARVFGFAAAGPQR